MSLTNSLANAGGFTTAPANDVRIYETNELLGTTATGFSSDSSVSVTRTSATVLSIGNSSSATAPQYVRFGYRSRAITTAISLTITGGTGKGTVNIYAYLDSTNALHWYITDTSGNTFTIGGTGNTVASATNAAIPGGAVLIWTWLINATAAQFDSLGGTNAQPNEDTWVDEIEIANETASAVTITVTDGQGTPINLFDATSVPANGTIAYERRGGRFFDGGVFLTAGSTSALQVNLRACRLRHNPGIAGLNP